MSSRTGFLCGVVLSGFLFCLPHTALATLTYISDDATGGDCSSVGVWDQTNHTCTLTSDVSIPILLTSGVVLDGAGHTLSGGGPKGAILYSNSVLKNITISGFENGVFLDQANNVVVSDAILTGNTVGIFETNGVGDQFLRNTIIGGSVGIWISTNLTSLSGWEVGHVLRGNQIEQSSYGLRVDAPELQPGFMVNDVDTSNTVDGRPIYYLVRASNTTFGAETNATTFYCVYCSNVTIRDMDLGRNTSGVFLYNSTNMRIDNVRVSDTDYGISLYSSNNSTIASSSISQSASAGVYLAYSDNNRLVENDIDGRSPSPGGIIPVTMYRSSGNVVTGNTVHESLSYALNISQSSQDILYRNNFISVARRLLTDSSGNLFASSTDGGNYWDTFDTPAEGCDDVGGDLVCDVPYLLDTVHAQSDPSPWVRANAWVQTVPPPPTKPDPVIIIPGILGSWDKNGTWVIDPVLHTYDNLIDTLVANGYEQGVDLFTLPYDWRQSNLVTALQLKAKIDAVRAICACTKVDLVAHSMGGLVARQYIQSGHYAGDVDQLIFLATPHLGSPDSYLSWEGGELKPRGLIEDHVQNFILSREATKEGYRDIFDYVRNKPIYSVQELLPTLDYLRDKVSGVLRTYPNNYPVNAFLENLNSNTAALLASGVRITNFVGSTTTWPTINTLRVVDIISSLPKWAEGYPEGFNEKIGDRGLEYGAGDGTVPLSSAESINKDLIMVPSSHGSIPTDVEGLAYKKLTGKDAQTLVTIHGGLGFSGGKFLIIKLLSPVDMQIVAPDGKRIGKDFVTGQEVNEIAGAFYSGFLTDDEYAVIPNPLSGDYRVLTTGTGQGGEYTVASGLISNATSSSIDTVAYTLPGQGREVDVVVSDGLQPIAATDTTPVFQGDIQAHIRQMFSLGWINKADYRDRLVNAVSVIDKLLKKRSSLNPSNRNYDKRYDHLGKAIDKDTQRLINKTLAEGLKKGFINQNGYNIVTEDINSEI